MYASRFITNSFSRTGKRSGNEDYLITGTVGEKAFFMVCDGVGGQTSGEVASRLVCETFQRFFYDNPQKEINESFIQEALSVIRASFDAHIRLHPESQQMATTLTLAILHPAGISMAHLGDSRIYYFRNGKILYQTRDHSLINELLDNDIISIEEAQNSNQKHVITRAVSAMSSQSAHPSYHLQTDVQTGDLIFLCSDGVTESLSPDALATIFKQDPDISDAIHRIESTCAQYSHDNHTGIIVQIIDK